MAKLISPSGVKLRVADSKVAALLRRGYRLAEEPVAAPVRRTRKKNPAPKEA